MPPSPSLSIRMAMVTYLMLVIAINVHTIRDSTPSTAANRDLWISHLRFKHKVRRGKGARMVLDSVKSPRMIA
jgi:hypothetical protein